MLLKQVKLKGFSQQDQTCGCISQGLRRTETGTSNLRKHHEICKEHKAWKAGQADKQDVIDKEGKLKKAWLGSISVTRQTTPPHSRRSARKDIVKIYNEKKEALKKWFSCNKQRVSITTDIWVSQTTGFKHITDHKGRTIASVLLECLAEWRIEKVFCITVDNASANSTALRKFHSAFALVSDQAFVLDGEFLHMRCSAHIINLIVRDGMAEVDHSVAAIRNGISYFRSYTNKLRSFECKVDSGKITRGSLPLDVKTRWNSTYLMLTTATKFKVALDKMEAEDRLYNDYFCEIENGAKRIGPPQLKDWKTIDKLCQFLMIFYNSTLVASASTSLNAHKCYGEIVTIATDLIGLSSSPDPDLKSKASEMYKNFDKYWDGLKNMNMMLVVATVFDPSNKLELAKMCFEELYGADSIEYKEMYDSLIGVLRSLFKEHSARHGSRGDPGDSSSQSKEKPKDQCIEKMDLVDDCAGYRRMDFRYKQKLNEIGVREKRDELETYLRESMETRI
ncbi:zinc finger BED domain-containing protein RICESLEEPER 2-like [Raphanus sativus]|uniref:Zinc finger BED domain-containing protein RICESLEEPER 2-like n=1 Tax=Raphanus sativus TaxID=3726 RepID=A0A6J0MSN5_RAPSA|nr:zinc finger BED domain-containing protein RICESLEEPER 2-like [Raphanus sativus]XP_056846200.1 zinc finger BED domain-containing protein RICESLEEPER 2-like [Raphanus sativus]